MEEWGKWEGKVNEIYELDGGETDLEVTSRVIGKFRGNLIDGRVNMEGQRRETGRKKGKKEEIEMELAIEEYIKEHPEVQRLSNINMNEISLRMNAKGWRTTPAEIRAVNIRRLGRGRQGERRKRKREEDRKKEEERLELKEKVRRMEEESKGMGKTEESRKIDEKGEEGKEKRGNWRRRRRAKEEDDKEI